MSGHRVGCRCVGCSPATRARGMSELLKRKVKATGVVRRTFTRFDAAPRGMVRRNRVQTSARNPQPSIQRNSPILGVVGGRRITASVVGRLPGHVLDIRYERRGDTAHPGLYRHRFGPGVVCEALSDGSIRIRGPKPVWGKL